MDKKYLNVIILLDLIYLVYILNLREGIDNKERGDLRKILLGIYYFFIFVLNKYF